MVAGVADRVAYLEGEVQSLRAQVARLEERLGELQVGPYSSAQVLVTVGSGSEAAPPGSAARGASVPPPRESSTILPSPQRSCAKSALDSRVKHYVVVSPNCTGEPGVYLSYGGFANAVRDPSAPWSGRGLLPWAPGAEGYSYATRREAEESYREKCGLSGDSPIA